MCFNIYQSRTAPLKVSEDNKAKVKFKEHQIPGLCSAQGEAKMCISVR